MTAYGLSAASADAALTAIVVNWAYAQLHTADPGAAGTTAVSSVTTREAITWGSAASEAIAATNQPTWSDWGGSTETDEFITGWLLSTGSTAADWGGTMALSADVTMEAGDELELTSIGINIPVAG
jgi:hypothetical protein